nr:reverse transcriptase domain-containing protein [Tanacetum cinerariifolium]
MSAVRNTLGKQQIPQDLDMPASNAALREYYDRNYYQLLPIIAEKVHQDKVQQEKLKAVKAHLNFDMIESPEPRHDHFESPRKKDSERRTVFKRLEKGVFHRLGDKGKSIYAYSNDLRRRSYHSSRGDTKSCYQSSRSRETEFASGKCHNKRASSQRMEPLSGRFMHGITNPELIKCLHDKIPKSIDEMMKVTTAFLRGRLSEPREVRAKTGQRIAKQRITQNFSSESMISFPPLEEEDRTDDPMIIEAGMGGHFIHHMSPSPYNGIIGRPGIRRIQAVSHSRNVEIPSDRRNAHITEQQDYSARMHNGLRTKSTSAHNRSSHRIKDSGNNSPRILM